MTLAGSASPLAYSPGSARASIETQAVALSTLNAQYANLSTTVSTQGSSITANANAITTLQGQTATLVTQVTAGNKNLIVNGGPENGIAGWSNSGGSLAINGTGYGPLLQISTTAATSATNSTQFAVSAGSAYIATCNSQLGGPSGTIVTFSLIWLNSSGSEITRTSVSRSAHGYANAAANRLANTVTGTAPGGAANALFQAQIGNGSSGTTATLFIGQVKAEYGSVATAYSAEASVAQSFSALSTLTTQYASLSSTVSTQGVTVTQHSTAITTLQTNVNTVMGRWGVEIDVNGYVSGVTTNNNGTRADFTIRADKFAIVSPGGGARTEYSNGNWRVYNAAGVLKVQLGVNI